MSNPNCHIYSLHLIQVDKMASVPEQLLEAVDELDNDKPKRQKSAITADELEKADAVDGLMQTISPSHTAVSVDLKAETGATVNSPILAGNIIQGSVIFSFNSTTGAVGKITALSHI